MYGDILGYNSIDIPPIASSFLNALKLKLMFSQALLYVYDRKKHQLS